jgi:hypothetical protein
MNDISVYNYQTRQIDKIEFSILGNDEIIAFTKTPEYEAHKSARIKGADKREVFKK